ncbi:UDP-glycosyltransferase 73D1-like [Musa acuminata AAA Group]|uniref:UDP-glycosyltransferase 73D1-like n=1 Tax=Musa acuminata AAA Group TaxID=214697 RepID=UPI0031E33931
MIKKGLALLVVHTPSIGAVERGREEREENRRGSQEQNEASLRVGSLPGAGPWPHANTTILLAKHGAIVSFITAPINAARTDAVISHARRVGLPTDFVEPPFPCTKVGVPEGCENVDLLPSMSLLQPFFTATSVLHQPLKQHLQAQRQAPGCMVADCCNPWMREFAKELRIAISPLPRPLLLEKFREEVREAKMVADGFVINTFETLDATYIECYTREVKGKKVWI